MKHGTKIVGAVISLIAATRFVLVMADEMRRDRFAFDLHPYYLQARALFDEPDVYAVSSDLVFRDLETTLPLTYSLVLKPFADLATWELFAVVFFVVNVVVFCLGLRLMLSTFELTGINAVVFVALVVSSFPVTHNFAVGQLGAFTFTGAAALVYCASRGNYRSAGIALGAIAALKVSPLLVVPLAAVVAPPIGWWALATMAGIQVATHTIVGWSYFTEYWFDVLPAFNGSIRTTRWNQSGAAFGTRFSSERVEWLDGLPFAEICLAVFVALPFAVLVFQRYKGRRWSFDEVAFFVLPLSFVLIDLGKSTTWPHHMTWHAVTFAAVIGLRSKASGSDWVLVLASAAAVFYVAIFPVLGSELVVARSGVGSPLVVGAVLLGAALVTAHVATVRS